jgi:hypothetical protein
LDRNSSVPKKAQWRDVKGQGILKAAAYLRENFEIECANYHEWNAILDHFELRHCFAHANGDVSLMRKESQVRIRRILGKPPFSHNRIDHAHRLRLDPQYIAAARHQMAEMCPVLHDAFFYDALLGPLLWPSSSNNTQL